MTDEDRKAVWKSFRKYLRTREGITGDDLNTIIQAAEHHVPALVRRRVMPEFGELYDNSLGLKQLLFLERMIEQDEQALTQRQGYACFRAIRGYARFYADTHGLNIADYLPDENNYPVPDEDLPLHEGREYEVRGIRYERDKDARSRCIEHYGCRCQVCGMSFEEVYGEIGKHFIEVHHLIPISERGGDYVVDPVNDLIPICSNCHSMVHRIHGMLLSPNKLKRLVESNRHTSSGE